MTESGLIDLGTLLTDELLPSDTSLTLWDAELDTPLRYIFESDGESAGSSECWIEAIGAGRQLASLPNQLSAALPQSSLILQADVGQMLTLVPDSSDPTWAARLARIPPDVTGIVTLSTGVIHLTTKQVFRGLYHAPENVIGIPGMTVHQARVNRYYHVESQSTVPAPDRVVARRHFGEVVALVRHLVKRTREERSLVPFYECLPLVERCGACRTRPAEPGPSDKPLCGICRRKREAAGAPNRARWAAVIGVRLPNVDRLLMEQPTPGAYQRTAAAFAEAWRYALFEAEKSASGVMVVWQSSAAAWLIAPAAAALAAANAVCQAFATADNIEGASLCVGIALGNRGAQTGYRIAQAALTDALADAARSGNPGAIRVRLVDERGAHKAPPDPDGLRYSSDTLDRLYTAAHDLAVRYFPVEAFSELSEVLTRQTAQAAALYFEHSRTRLDEGTRRLLDPLISNFSSVWGVGTARFFRAMADVFGLQALIQ